MAYLLISVACSVLVSVLLKLMQRRGIDTAQGITWNYLAASLLCLGLLDPPLAALGHAGTPWAELTLLALLLPGIFLALSASVRAAGIVRTDIAQRMSLVLSLLAAFLWFGEQANALRIAGLVLGIIAIACLVARPERGRRGDGWQAWALPLLVLVGYASVDVLLKRLAAAGAPFAASLQVAFVAAFAVMLLTQGLRLWRSRRPPTRAAFAGGLLLGALNFANILFYVKAHRALPDHPAVVFSMMNIGVVVLGTLVGVSGFGERLSRLNLLAIPLAVIAIGLIAAGIG
ncbi:EamA/RhaT family transporter [Pseudoxanthomonas sp. F37]|uniref:EamA family transporter n=1 Tax=Pseudoxanthomonas TaxID=83618 RepID=UPI001FD1847F|nr:MULTISPECIES: EamA/RhaT family transporter [Pseudoxanthomonas]UOV06755.1 EamA/RhaT family transporter [Pseudoxanthomonas mexicana]UOV08367.1 EamA/RhaT family transporter [Pseudoxanthomonas sp. F37]